MSRSKHVRSQKMTILLGIVCIMLLIVILQLWLFTATMEAYLSGDNPVVVPAALASLVCLGLNLGLLHYVRALDR